MTSPVERLLNLGNRMFSAPAVYVRKGQASGIPVQVTRESHEAVQSATGAVPQSFRVASFSTDADSLTEDDAVFLPDRGDRLTVGNERYRVIENGGVTWVRRFGQFKTRILFFCEQEAGDAAN